MLRTADLTSSAAGQSCSATGQSCSANVRSCSANHEGFVRHINAKLNPGAEPESIIAYARCRTRIGFAEQLRTFAEQLCPGAEPESILQNSMKMRVFSMLSFAKVFAYYTLSHFTNPYVSVPHTFICDREIIAI